MFKAIFLFELKQGFKKPSTYIFFGIFFAFYFVLGLAVAGVLPLATSDSNILINSASGVAGILLGTDQTILGLINSIVLIAVMATSIYKDYEYNVHPLFFTKPINKSGYFFGRFIGAFVITLFVFSSQVIGFMLACTIGSGNPNVADFHLMNYLEPVLIFIIPNLLLLGVIYFALTTFTRTTMAAYIVSIVVLALRTVASLITSGIDNKTVAAYLEPFGLEALNKMTQYWTPDEQNHLMIPFSGEILYNRLIWLAVAVFITYYSYTRFSFSQFLSPVSVFRKKKTGVLSTASAFVQSFAALPVAKKDFSWKAKLNAVLYIGMFEFKKMVRSIFFIIVSALAVIIVVLINFFAGQIFGTETYPVTYKLAENGAQAFTLFINIIIIILSGIMVWRERDNKVDELTGSSPITDRTIYFGKYFGLVLLVGLLMIIIMLTGIGIQMSQNYYRFEIGEYLTTLFGFRAIQFILLAGFCLAVQTIFSNKYIGFFLVCVILLLQVFLYPALDWNNILYIFNSSGPTMPYSDMNGYGHYAGTFWLVKLYWLSIVLFLTFFSLRFFARGKEKKLKARYLLSKHANGRKSAVIMAACLVIAISLGSYIYYNIKVLNKMIGSKQQEAMQVEFEKKYKKYEKTLQPRVVESNVKVNIYPRERKFEASGFFYLKNKHNKPVDTLVLNYDQEATYKKLTVSNGFTKIVEDTDAGFQVWKLNKSIAPGDSVKLDFELEKAPRGFKNSSTDHAVVYNGTFLNSGIFPTLGYNADFELSENSARKKYGLKKKPRMANVNDSLARMNTYISNDADWIRFEAVVSTSDDQTAIAPGYLQKQWQENGRNFFHYKMDCPILNFYSFQSARYEVKRDKWLNPADPSKPVAIEIYYQKGHEYNLDRMIKGIKKSLDYYTKNFSPYQHRQVRIIEFPRYDSFAQSFPNTIPFSESIGFIAKVEANNDKIDYPFYVTAHEVGHQWWAHQVIGGNVQGGTLMSETMAQYSALMVMEKEYGKEQMKKFLEYEMNTYLKGRATESKKELPLMKVENQLYIHYNKGSVVMYALKDYIGEDTLNAALRRYIKKVAYQEPPYTNSIEFVNFLRAATPDSLKYIIKDMFETITVYENYIKDLSYTKRSDGKYDVKLTLGSVKFRADSLGKQKKVKVADYIDVGIFAEKTEGGKVKDKELLLKKIKMDKDVKTFTFVVDEKPVKAGIDPYMKLIDRDADNNTWKFGSKPPKVSTDAGNDNLMLVLGGGEED